MSDSEQSQKNSILSNKGDQNEKTEHRITVFSMKCCPGTAAHQFCLKHHSSKSFKVRILRVELAFQSICSIRYHKISSVGRVSSSDLEIARMIQ